MLIQSMVKDSGKINHDGLMDYLSKVVLSKVDSLTEEEHYKYTESKINLSNLKEELRHERDNFNRGNAEFSKLKLIRRILSFVKTLRRKGSLAGKRKEQILVIVDNIFSKTISDLRELEEKLVLLLPDEKYTD